MVKVNKLVDPDGNLNAYNEHGSVVGRYRGNGNSTLQSIWVAPNSRRQGHGTNLLLAFLDWVRNLGAKEVELKFDPEPGAEKKSKEFYVKHGFEEGEDSVYRKRI